MVSYQYAPFVDGGAERQAQRQAEELARRGWRVGVATARYPGLPRRELINGVEIHRLFAIPRKRMLSATFLPSLAAFLMTTGRSYDVWHSHQAYYNAWVALELARLVRRPVVVKAAASGPFGDIARLQGRTLQRRLTSAMRHAGAVIALNGELREELVRAGIPADRVRVIPNGVDLERYAVPSPEGRRRARERLGVSEDARVAVYVGRLVPEKGIDTLLDAWPGVIRAVPRARLLVAGGGDVGGYARRAEASSVSFLGKVEDIRPVLAAADLLVLPSESEGLSNAVLEAMATGIPSVGTTIGGLIEQIADGETGLLVPLRDADALRGALTELLGDPARCARMGRDARARAERCYALGRVVDEYVKLYRELAS